MFLGIMLFFDAALLALGNVCSSNLCLLISSLTSNSYTDALLVWSHLDHWPSKDILLLRAEAETSRDGMLHWWDSTGVHEVCINWNDRGDIWLLEPVWVRGIFSKRKFELIAWFSDFFPVVVTFMRQLPFIGNILSLPFIRPVRALY